MNETANDNERLSALEDVNGVQIKLNWVDISSGEYELHFPQIDISKHDVPDEVIRVSRNPEIAQCVLDQIKMLIETTGMGPDDIENIYKAAKKYAEIAEYNAPTEMRRGDKRGIDVDEGPLSGIPSVRKRIGDI